MKNRVRYAVFAFLVEVRGFVATMERNSEVRKFTCTNVASARTKGFTLQSNGTMKSCKIPA